MFFGYKIEKNSGRGTTLGTRTSSASTLMGERLSATDALIVVASSEKPSPDAIRARKNRLITIQDVVRPLRHTKPVQASREDATFDPTVAICPQ